MKSGGLLSCIRCLPTYILDWRGIRDRGRSTIRQIIIKLRTNKGHELKKGLTIPQQHGETSIDTPV